MDLMEKVVADTTLDRVDKRRLTAHSVRPVRL